MESKTRIELDDLLIAECDPDELVAAVRDCFSCRDACVSDDLIWIADPQRGHWLGADERRRLVKYLIYLRQDDDCRLEAGFDSDGNWVILDPRN
jgi:hypothetical protein